MKKADLIMFGIVLVSFIVGFYFYPQMPDQMASHWNTKGEVDDYMPKLWGVFLFPFVFLVMAVLFVLIPRIDPLKKNISKFMKYFDGFKILFLVLMFLVYFLTLLWNLGLEISPNIFMPVLFGPLFYYIGIMCEKAKRNWFIGIRTPWTLSSEKVWDKTHKIGGKMFKISGLIALLGIFFRDYTFYLFLVPLIFTVLFTLFYSYFEYQKEK